MADELSDILPEIRFKPVVSRYKMVADLIPEIAPGSILDNEFLNDLTEALEQQGQYPPDAVIQKHVGILLSSFSGKPGVPPVLDSLAWRLAACHDILNAGEQADLQFALVEKPDWLPLQIVSACFIRVSRKMKPMLEVQFRVLSGKTGGLLFWQQIPHSWFVSKLGRELGGGSRTRRYPDYRELGGFWLVGKLDTWNPEQPRLQEFRVNSSALDHNRRLRKTREQACPLNFPQACHECWVGRLESIPPAYSTSRCFAFTRKSKKSFELLERPVHPCHFVMRRCSYCKKAEAFFEPTQRSRYCVHCQAAFVHQYRRF